MTRELVLLSEQNEQYEIKLSELESVEKEFKVFYIFCQHA